MIDLKPGDAVSVVGGEHAGRRGVVLDHVRMIRVLEETIKPGEIRTAIRRRYEAGPGQLTVRLDPDDVTGHIQTDRIVDLRPAG